MTGCHSVLAEGRNPHCDVRTTPTGGRGWKKPLRALVVTKFATLQRKRETRKGINLYVLCGLCVQKNAFISRRLRRKRRITGPINDDHAGAGIRRIAPASRCAMRGVNVKSSTRKHGDTEGLEILAIRYLWNKANSFVFFLRELIKGQGPRVHRTIKSLRRTFPFNPLIILTFNRGFATLTVP